MNLSEYQRSRSFIDLAPNLSDSTFLNFFSLETAKSIEVKFHVNSPLDGMVERKFAEMVKVT